MLVVVAAVTAGTAVVAAAAVGCNVLARRGGRVGRFKQATSPLHGSFSYSQWRRRQRRDNGCGGGTFGCGGGGGC